MLPLILVWHWLQLSAVQKKVQRFGRELYMPEQQTKKEQLRQYYRTLRKERTAQEKQRLDLAMQERFCASACYRNSKVLLLYAATIAEPETEWILSQALQDEKIVGLPKCLPERQMVFCQVTNSQQLHRGAYGILEPDAACPTLKSLPETGCVCLVPGLAFDRAGYRLGYGGGYYDRFLQQHPQLIRVGYCPSMHIAETLPREETDCPVQYLITEQTEEELYGSET